ncbi:MAG: YbaB/EbfC family nucleoid-associated protein [Planctomycetes bacterium]|nr:YbaB/EbfC family nucleoid-associated protein [Planctomycetota bacterium]
MLKDLLNLPNLIRQLDTFGGRYKETMDRLRGERFAGTSGGTLVEVQVNGIGEVLQVRIDPRLIERKEQEMIQDLLPAAINQALEKGRQAQMQAMQEITGSLDVPGISKLMDSMLGGSK